MEKQMKKNTKIILIIVLCLIVLVIPIGYAALSRNLNVNGTAEIATDWKVTFSSISLKDSNSIIKEEHITNSNGATKATFNVTLKKPGSYAVYEIVVENKGNINAKLESISDLSEINSMEPKDIKYTIIGPSVGSELKINETAIYTVKVEWLSSSTSAPEETSKTATIELQYVQNN